MNPRPSGSVPQSAVAGPFAADDERAYRRWRDEKLARYPGRTEDLIVEVRDPHKLSAGEAERIRRNCRIANMAIYASPLAGVADKGLPRTLGEQLGLTRLDANPLADEDGISSLEVAPGKSERGYTPYSNQRLLWHTDGYYNPAERRIRAFILHCVRPAAEGGTNRLLDPDIAYILLRDADPDHIRALCAADVMTIPANALEGAAPRPAQTGPVFSIDGEDGSLHMRYTARTRSVAWRPDESTRAAVRCVERLLGSDSPFVFIHRLTGGQGLVCNNVLHDRTAFTVAPGNEPGRLVYRARYRDRVAGTGLASAPNTVTPAAKGLRP
ncbi:MAG: TauD/TfdA family dioxygenase [Casimicrobiaceae bacterium]